MYLSHAKVLSNHIFVGIHQVTICCEMHKLNVVQKFFALVFNTTICMKQTTLARLGTTGLPLNNSSVMKKFDELLISLYSSDARVLSNHISVRIHQVINECVLGQARFVFRVNLW